MFKRNVQDEIEAFLRIMPVVLITGARQTGKTTLVEAIAKEKNFSYFSFDDEFSLSNAKRDPSGWIAALPKPVILDEVQRLPEIFLAIKRDVDQNRYPGRYLLTGSANPLLLPRLGDSLAGRMGIVQLFPLSQGELHNKKEGFLDWIFSDTLTTQKFTPLDFNNFCHMLLKGGFPTVQSFQDVQDINRWMNSYLQTMMERDIKDISEVALLREFPRLFKLLATRSGALLNISDISRSLGMIHMTVNRYLRLLETLYFIYQLSPWYTNHAKRLVKSPKLQLCDTAILAGLLSVDLKKLQDDPYLLGHFLESFVFAELLKQKSWSKTTFELYYFRDGDYEVDFVLELNDGAIFAIEVKSAKTLSSNDLRGLNHLKKLAKGHFKRGVVLHFGTQVEKLGEDLWALPIQALWDFTAGMVL